MIDVIVSSPTIDIGRQGENLARNIYFDLSDLTAIYGEGTATLVHMRPSDQAPYICTAEVVDDYLVWSPTSTDTAFSGSGKCELRWVVGESLAKSIIYTTTILPSITGAGEVPSAYQSWYDAMIDFIRANMSGVPYDVRGAIYTLFSKAEYTETVDDELAVVEAWATAMMTVTNTLTNCTNSNPATMTPLGGSYTATLTAGLGYILNSVNVTMGGEDVTATVYSSGTITIPSVTGDIVISATAIQAQYASIETDAEMLTISGGGTGTLGVKLSEQPTQSQTVTLFSDTLTLSSASITFTTSNWNTYQYVTATAPSVDDTTYAYINLTNSDPLMTETTVMVNVKGIEYEDLVDTTIPTTGQHVLTTSDFTSTANTTIDGQTYVRLYGYSGAYDNVVMPAEMDGKKTLTTTASASPSASNSSFAQNTTVKYISFEDGCRFGEGGAPTNNSGVSAFTGCTSLIGVSNLPTSIVNAGSMFNGCTNFKFADNLDELVNVTAINNAFANCTSLEYIQDLSDLTRLNNVQMAFRASGLKKIFGLPNLNTTTANATNIYSACASLQYGIIPKGVNNCNYAFYNCTSLRRVDIFEDNLSTSALPSTCFSGCRNLKVYCNAGTTTYNSLITNFGSSTQITIIPFGGSNLPSIVVWGDSISSPNKAWVEWPKRLATKLGTTQYVVKNEAIAGEWSTSTTARQGGYVITVSEAFQIPADTTAVVLKLQTVTLAGTEIWSTAPLFSCAGSYNPCTIAGVSGTLSRSGSQYYFKRLSAGDAVSVSAGATVTSNSDTTYNAAGNVMLFYLNGNGGWDNDADKLLEMFQKAVDHFEALGGTDYIVAGPAANSELTKANIMSEVQSFEAMAATAFGNHWLNLREYEIANGLTQNGLTASALDTTRMAAGLVPASLVGGGSTSDIQMYDGETNTDQNHPNVYGANTIMLAFYEKGVELGYWT